MGAHALIPHHSIPTFILILCLGSFSKTNVVHHSLTITPPLNSNHYSEPLIVTTSNLRSAIVAFARFLDKMPAKNSLKDVRKGKDDPFLAFQFKSAAGELKFSDSTRGDCDLLRTLEHLLFPSDMIFPSLPPTMMTPNLIPTLWISRCG